MIDTVQCPNCGAQTVVTQQPDSSGDTAISVVIITDQKDALIEPPGSPELDVRCLTCGHSWNLEEQLRQAADDQAQADALDFGVRKQTFYEEFESGHYTDAKRDVPKEARLIYKREGLYATYKYLKSLDKELARFKNTFMLVGITLFLLIVGVIVYACS